MHYSLLLTHTFTAHAHTNNTALLMYNQLFAAFTVAKIAGLKAHYFGEMDQGDVAYLNRLEDECQYPAARCAMGDDICLSCLNRSEILGSGNCCQVG